MKTQRENLGSELTGQVIGAEIAAHREFGPGLDQADYERALHLEKRCQPFTAPSERTPFDSLV